MVCSGCKNEAPSTVLAFSPHADDIELGAGGTLLKWSKLGAKIHVLLCSARDEAHLSHGDVTRVQRLEEFYVSTEKMSAEPHVSEFAGLHLDTVPKASLVMEMDKLMADVAPDVVMLPVPSFHQEHQYVHDCSIAACRPSKTVKPKYVYAYEYPAANWGLSAGYNPAFGGVYSDISDYIEEKLDLLRVHKSQHLENEGLVSLSSVEALARMRGRESGFKYAELLYLLRGYF